MRMTMHGLVRGAAAMLIGMTLQIFPARAQTANGPEYSVFNPVADNDLRPFCTDRPTKGTGPCTVDAGHLQIESDLFNASLQNSDGEVTDTYLYTNPTFRLGLTETLDVELNIAPYEEVVTHDHVTGARSDVSGIGDTFVRLKTSLTGNGQGVFSAALDPFVKIPTAPSAIGNGAVEGGLVVPLQYALSELWSLSLAPEVDALKDQLADGHHAACVMDIGVSRAVSSQVSATAEFWTNANFDPAGTVYQKSLDIAGTWQPSGVRDLQLDAGANFGIDRNTPAVQLYFGISRRF
jgi:hypothetical protein